MAAKIEVQTKTPALHAYWWHAESQAVHSDQWISTFQHRKPPWISGDNVKRESVEATVFFQHEEVRQVGFQELVLSHSVAVIMG